MKGHVLRIVIASLQTAALILFSAAAPLAHLHQGDRGHFDHYESHGERPRHYGITFHSHLDSHPHGSNQESTDDPSSQGESHHDSLNISHGRMDSPRVERPSSSLLALASKVQLTSSSTTCLALSDARFDVYRPPPLLFRKPVRAPPSTC